MDFGGVLHWFEETDSEDGSRSFEGISDGQTSRRLSGKLRRSSRRQRARTSCGRFCLLRWRRFWVERRAAAKWRCSAGRRKSCCASILQLEHGIPSHDTFSRVFRLLDPEAFEKAFRQFMAAFAKANGIDLTGVVAIDGKALRGAYERGKIATPLHMVNVFADGSPDGFGIAQGTWAQRGRRALWSFWRCCSLEGCIVTSDALHCSRPFAAAVLGREAPTMCWRSRKIRAKLFDCRGDAALPVAASAAVAQAARTLHSRPPRSAATQPSFAIPASVVANRFPGVAAVARITSRRRRPRPGEPNRPLVRYYLLSKSISAKPTAARSCAATGGSKTGLHWILDVVFAEDANRARKDNAPENLAILRRLALNIIRNHPATDLLAAEGQARGLGQCFPSRGSHPYAIALPLQGRVTEQAARGGGTMTAVLKGVRVVELRHHDHRAARRHDAG